MADIFDNGTLFDLAVLVLVGLSALLAMSRGVVREGLGILTWVVAFVIAWLSYDAVHPYVASKLQHPLLADLGTALVVFLVPLTLLKILVRVVAGGVSGVFTPLDRGLGFVFGLARGAFIVVAGYLVASAVIPPRAYPSWVQDAALLPAIEDGADHLAAYLPDDFRAQSETIAREAGARAERLRQGDIDEATRTVDRPIEENTR